MKPVSPAIGDFMLAGAVMPSCERRLRVRVRLNFFFGTDIVFD